MAKEINPDIETDTLDGTFPLVFNINNTLWETIENAVPKKTNKFSQFVQKYRDINFQKLETPYPLDYPIWYQSCENIVYETLGIDEEDLYKITSNIELPNGYVDKYLQKGHGQSAMIIQFALLMLYRYYLLKGRTREIEICKYFISYFFYYSIFTKYFKRFKPIPQVMEYTINSMSFKNQIKTLGSVSKWIYVMVDSSMRKYDMELRRGADVDYYKVIRRTHVKFNDAMKNVYGAYDKDYRNKKRIFESTAFNDDDTMADQNSLGSEIITLADKYTTRFFENPNSEEVIKIVCNKKAASGYIPERDLRNTIFNIADEVSNQVDVRRFYQAIFYLFFNNQNGNRYDVKDITTIKFVLEMQKMYKAGNSINKNRIIIGDIIDKWLKIGSQTYRTTNREATKSIFKKAIFDYFILKVIKDK